MELVAMITVQSSVGYEIDVSSLPALEANLISSDVKVTIREYGCHFAKKLLQEVENILLN